MHMLCPHCHNPIELVDLASGKELVCPSCGSSFQLERGCTTTDWRPRKLGKFDLLEEVGIGAFGTVYKARDPELDRVVAIKVPRAGNLPSSADLDRFLREARSVAQLRHQGIVPIHEVGQQETVPYLVSDFVQGITLADQLAVRRPGFREAAELIAAVADALQYAHEQGVVHRDVKPSNIMLETVSGGVVSGKEEDTTSGSPLTTHHSPKLMDFGLAKREAGEITMTMEGEVLGTPAYMSPEQARGEAHKVDGRSDVYSLGVILYRMLTGELPFRGNTRMLLHQVLQDEPRSPRSLNDHIPRDLETICLKAMAQEPERRYATARELADDLRRFLKGEAIQARRNSVAERSWRWCRRNPAVASLLAALLLVFFVGFAAVAVQWLRAETHLGEAERQRSLAQEKAETLRRQDYNSRVNLAYRECLANDVTRALELLDGCPEDLRGWEWLYVQRQCHLELDTFRESAPSVNCVAFSPDGKRLASASGPFFVNESGQVGDVVVRDVATGQEVFARRGLPGGVCAVAFSPDGRWLASGNASDLVLWDATTGQERFRKQGGPLPILSLAFSPDSRRIVAGYGRFNGHDIGYAKIWDATTGDELINNLPGHRSGVWSVAFSPEGKQVALTSYGLVELWDLQERKPVQAFHGHAGWVHTVAFSPDGRQIASGGNDRTIKLWDRASGELVRTYSGHEGFVRGLAFSPKGQCIVSASEDKSVKLWQLTSDRELATFHGHAHFVNCVAFSPDGLQVASGSLDQTIKLWFATPTYQLSYLGHDGWVDGVAFSPDGQQVATASTLDSTGNFLQLWDPATGKHLLSFRESRSRVNAVAFSPDGRRLASANWDRTVQVWDTVTGRKVLTLSGHSTSVCDVTFSPDGQYLTSVSGDKFDGGTVPGEVAIWDAHTGQAIHWLRGHARSVLTVAFSPDGQQLATAGGDKTVKVWDASTGREIRTLAGHAGPVYRVAFNPDGKRLVSVGGIWQDFGEVKVWDWLMGQEIHNLRGHTDRVFSVAFSPDGRRLATASDDRTVKLWDPATGQEVFTLRGHTSGVRSVAFSPDGQRLVSGSIDWTARVWDIGPLSAEVLQRREAMRTQGFLPARPSIPGDGPPSTRPE